MIQIKKLTRQNLARFGFGKNSLNELAREALDDRLNYNRLMTTSSV